MWRHCARGGSSTTYSQANNSRCGINVCGLFQAMPRRRYRRHEFIALALGLGLGLGRHGAQGQTRTRRILSSTTKESVARWASPFSGRLAMSDAPRQHGSIRPSFARLGETFFRVRLPAPIGSKLPRSPATRLDVPASSLPNADIPPRIACTLRRHASLSPQRGIVNWNFGFLFTKIWRELEPHSPRSVF